MEDAKELPKVYVSLHEMSAMESFKCKKEFGKGLAQRVDINQPRFGLERVTEGNHRIIKL